MSEWKKTTIGEEAEVFVGFPFRSEAFAKRGVRLLRGDNIGQGRLDWSDAECLPDEIASDHADYHLRAGDTVLAMDRPWVSAGLKYARVTEHDTPSLLVQRTARLRSVGEANADFLHYVIAGQTYEKYIRFITTGSLVPHISKEQIQAFPFSLPPMAVQKRIATVLSAIDAKIDLNNRINVELEALAKTIYDYWFVQFDFPDANGRPYKSSGGKMVWNDALKREIPAGWEVGALSDIANITMGQSPAGESYNVDGHGVVFFQGSTDFGTRSPDVRMFTTSPGRMAREGDILVSVRAPVGTLNIADRACCIGRGLAAMHSKNGSNGYLYRVMADFKQVFDRRSSEGTTFGSITKDDLFGLKVLIPDGQTLKTYSRMANDWMRLAATRDKEARELVKLRDWLLPLLMNGQVRVGT